jgi:hypothetical protein
MAKDTWEITGRIMVEEGEVSGVLTRRAFQGGERHLIRQRHHPLRLYPERLVECPDGPPRGEAPMEL